MTSTRDDFKEGKKGCRMGAEGLVLVCMRLYDQKSIVAAISGCQNEDDFAYVL